MLLRNLGRLLLAAWSWFGIIGWRLRMQYVADEGIVMEGYWDGKWSDCMGI